MEKIIVRISLENWINLGNKIESLEKGHKLYTDLKGKYNYSFVNYKSSIVTRGKNKGKYRNMKIGMAYGDSIITDITHITRNPKRVFIDTEISRIRKETELLELVTKIKEISSEFKIKKEVYDKIKSNNSDRSSL